MSFTTCGNNQCRRKDLCVLTSAAFPSTSPLRKHPPNWQKNDLVSGDHSQTGSIVDRRRLTLVCSAQQLLEADWPVSCLHCLYLGETPPCTLCSGEHSESTPGTWEPGVEGVKGACKGEEKLVEGKAADVNTQRSLLLH